MRLGTHWIAEASGCEVQTLNERTLRRLLDQVPDALGLTRVSPAQLFVHSPVSPGGKPSVAGIVLIAESHFSLHAFPELCIVHVDLFSCAAFSVRAAREELQAAFHAVEWEEQLLHRNTGSVTPA
jgi:S-adenosylmethionine decarboxylase